MSIRAHGIFLAVLLSASVVQASVRMPALFGNHMVLQQGVKVPVWGSALPGEKITVTAGDHTGSTTTGADGRWRVELKPFSASSAPLTLTITGSNTLTFQDVLIGEVWVASGQSNMEVPVSWMADGAQVSAQATDTQLRVFYVEHNPFQATSLTLRDDVAGQWKICTPEVTNNFSGVAYFFARELRARLKRPVGVIGSYVGGTPVWSWISLSGLMAPPAFSAYVDRYEAAKVAGARYAQDLADAQNAMSTYSDQYQAALAAALTQWKKETLNLEAGNNAQPGPPAVPPPPNPPRLPDNPAGDRHTPTVLYNALIAPLIPYAIKGVIWYQGEDNAIGAQGPVEYRTLFPRLITDWREKWGQGDFPFLYVQLAGFTREDIGGPGGLDWPLMREAQAMTLSLPKTGMATAVDIGAGTDIHPRDKLDVGLRLALEARHVAYGEDLVYSGPVYGRMAIAGSTVRVSFTEAGGGLIIGKAPWTAPNIEATPTTSLLGFTIAGADKKFVVATARIEGNGVVVSNPQVAAPVAVRYDWDNLTQANLYSKEGLPAFPFRSDTWDDVPSPANPPVMH